MTLEMESDRHVRRLARRGGASIVGAALSAVFGIALVAMITNGFPKDVAGSFFAASSAFLIVVAFVLLGVDTGLVKFLPQHLAHGRSRDVPATLRISVVPVAVISIVTAVVAYTLAPRTAELLVGPPHADLMTDLIRCLAVFIPIAAMNDVVMAASRGFGSMRPTVVVENVGRHVAQPVGVGIVYLAGAGAISLALAWALPYLLTVAAGAGWLVVLMRRSAARPGGTTTSTRGSIAREFWRFTAPRAIARLMQTGLKRVDILLVAALASPVEAALYTAATRFVIVGQLAVQAVQQALSPQLSRLFARDDRRAAQAVFRVSTGWIMAMTWPLYLLFAVFAEGLLVVFGDGYEAAADVVTILCLTMLLATASGPVDSVLLMAGRSWLSLFNSSVALALNIALNWFLIPSHGLTGAAIAWAAAVATRNLLPLLQIRRSLGLWPGSRGSAAVGASAILCFGALPTLLSAATDSLSWTLAASAAGAAVYLVIVWVLRDQLALQAFRAVLRRRNEPSGPG